MSRTRCSCGKYTRESQAQCKICFERDFITPTKPKRKSPRRKLALGPMLATGAMINLFMKDIKEFEGK